MSHMSRFGSILGMQTRRTVRRLAAAVATEPASSKATRQSSIVADPKASRKKRQLQVAGGVERCEVADRMQPASPERAKRDFNLDLPKGRKKRQLEVAGGVERCEAADRVEPVSPQRAKRDFTIDLPKGREKRQLAVSGVEKCEVADRVQPASPQRAKVTIDPPKQWQRDYEMICELRSDRTAVVDRMGSEAIAESACEADRAYQILISLMLSSQTKDTVTAEAMEKLRRHGLSVDKILATSDETLDGLISKARPRITVARA